MQPSFFALVLRVYVVYHTTLCGFFHQPPNIRNSIDGQKESDLDLKNQYSNPKLEASKWLTLESPLISITNTQQNQRRLPTTRLILQKTKRSKGKTRRY